MKYPYSLIAAISLLLSACYDDLDYDVSNIKIDDVFTIKQYTPSILANGRDTVVLNVELPADASDALSQVNFTTTRGSFLETDKKDYQATAKLVNVGDDKLKRIASATFKADISVGTAYIKIAVQGFEKTISIETTRNYASSAEVIPKALAITKGALTELNIIAKLRSVNGQVSKGQMVRLDVRDEDGNIRGSFRTMNNSSNENEECSFDYALVPPDDTFTGKLKLKVYDASGAELGSKEIYVIE